MTVSNRMVKAGLSRLLFYPPCLQNSHNFQIAHKCVLSALRMGWVLLPLCARKRVQRVLWASTAFLAYLVGQIAQDLTKYE